MAMSGKYVSQSDFHALARRNDAVGAQLERLGSVARAADDGSRIVRFVLSDGSVDRMGDVIDPYGWELTAFRANPVVLFAHLSSEPPVGRMVRTFVANDRLMGDVEFASADVYPFADQIYKLVVNGFIRACSVGFLPIEWQFSDDGDRQFGIDFKRQELLELSIVPVPANQNALVQAAVKSLAQRGAALAERPTPALSVMQYSGTAKERRWQLAHHLRQAIKRG
jgi:HK97 family phage prohead protease